MYINNKILVGKNENEQYILLNMANRHGLITGASGSGKTITLKVLAESFSSAGVPCFLADVKGDLSATSIKGDIKAVEERASKMGLENFDTTSYPVSYLDVYGIKGHPVRTTVSNIGARLLSRMMNLTEAQEGVLAIVFQIAIDEQLELVDLKDLKSLLIYVGENKSKYALKYGNITTQSIGAIQRNLLMLEQEDGDYFFGKPAFNIKDLIHYDTNDGRGYISILDAVTLFKKPMLYSTFLIWLLNEIYNNLDEVGDLAKPRLVLFFDEAHLLFSDAPNYIIKQIVQIVKLIRSKGVGIYFISQSPSDIPEEILSQLGNKVQHVLRSYTPKDVKTIKAAATAFRPNPNFKVEDEISLLATGEALVSFIMETGEPSVVEKCKILPPQSMMGVISEIDRKSFIEKGFLYNKYENKIDDETAFEKIEALNKETSEETKKEEVKKETQKKETKTTKKTNKYATKLANQTVNTIGRKLGNKIFNSIFK